MVSLVPGTPLFNEVFEGVNIPAKSDFFSAFPRWGELRNGFLNPSVGAMLGRLEVLNAQQARDLQVGARYLLRTLTVAAPGLPTGVPAVMLDGLRAVVRSVDVPAEITDSKLVNEVMAAKDIRGAATIVLGAGLAALGIAVPVVGTLAAAIVGLARAVYLAMERSVQEQNPASDAFRALAYRYFPPLQEADADIDARQINTVILGAMESYDWTRLWRPRWAGAWHGEERDGGFAFAKGDAAFAEKFDASQGESFSPTGGLGCIPGTDQITDIIQVALPHDPSKAKEIARGFWTFMRGGADPRNQEALTGVLGKTRVLDTGSFYPSSARLCAMLWDWASRRGNPLKYRIDTGLLQGEWRDYCESGIEYIRRVCYPWARKNTLNSDYKHADGSVEFYVIDPNANLEGYFGTAIFRAIGAWACSRLGDIGAPATYKVHPAPFGRTGDSLGGTKVYGQRGGEYWSRNAGPFLPIFDGDRWPDQCMGDRYSRGPAPIGAVLDGLRRAQRWELWHTLVSASARRKDAAFAADPDLEDELLSARAALLRSEARYGITLADVAEDEPGVPGLPGSQSWRAQLQASGVPVNNLVKRAPRNVALGGAPKRPTPEPPERLPFQGGNPNPWDPSPPAEPQSPRQSQGNAGAGLGLAIAGGGVALGWVAVSALRKKGRR